MGGLIYAFVFLRLVSHIIATKNPLTGGSSKNMMTHAASSITSSLGQLEIKSPV